MIPFLLEACPNLKTFGTASGTVLGLELAQNMSREEGIHLETNLEEVFIHLDMVKERDYSEEQDQPNLSKLELNGQISQNSPNLRSIIQNLGLNMFDEISDLDSEETFFTKEFCLDLWDKDVLEWVKADYRTNANIPNSQEDQIKSLLKHGDKMLKELKQNVDLATAT